VTPATGPTPVDADKIGAAAIRDFRQRTGLSDAELDKYKAWQSSQTPEAKAAAEAERKRAEEAGKYQSFAETAYTDAAKNLSASEKAALALIAPEADKMDPLARMDALKRAKAWAAEHAKPAEPTKPVVPAIPNIAPSGSGIVPSQSDLDKVQAAYDKAHKSGSARDAEAYAKIQREFVSRGIFITPDGHVGAGEWAKNMKAAGGTWDSSKR
jgi:hypothetical protein